MQNNIQFWRASNPVFFICCYLLIGFCCFNATSQYVHALDTNSLLCILISSICILGLCNAFSRIYQPLQVIPTFILLIWGACMANFNANASFLSDIVNTEWITMLRQFLLHKLDRSFADNSSNAFAKSLLFGTKSNMTETLQSAYQTLGILHIIAISGMHVDILFKLLEKCTVWLPNTRWARWTKLIALLLIVWTYTFIANAGPPVVRASLFFSTALIGRFFYLNFFSLNVISSGVLLVLLYNSHIISAIGLQLSYGAVIGIHFFYQPIALLAPMDNSILKMVWENLALSIAAQLTTLPILLYYFHTSSSLSMLGNFLFVPASTLLLYALLLLMVLPNIAGIQQALAKVISAYIETMNQSISLLYQFLQLERHPYQLGLAGLTYYYFCLFIGYNWVQTKSPFSLCMLLAGTSMYSFLKLFSV